VGSTLTASYQYGDEDGDREGVSTFDWCIAGTGCGYGSNKTYVIPATQRGKKITYRMWPNSVADPGVETGYATDTPAVTAKYKVTGSWIYDNTMPANISIPVSNHYGNVSNNVTVYLHLNNPAWIHTYYVLVSPDGTRYTLGSDYTMNDWGVTHTINAAGKNANGTWRVEVTQGTGVDTQVKEVQLTFY
jgi:hypothetical protein